MDYEQDRITERISKLLRMAEARKGNETEADQAMELAREMMAKYNLDMATVEAASKTTKGADRTKKENAGKASYPYQRTLMNQIGEVNFIHVHYMSEVRSTGRDSYRNVYTGYRLIGRKANVISAKLMFDYLDHTMNRMVVALGMHFSGKDAIAWKTGCAYRLGQRLMERHNTAQEEQSRRAREQYEAAKAAGLTVGALVVMDDYANMERDLNTDFAEGLEPGTTARKRAEWEAGEAKRTADWEARQKRLQEAEETRRAGLSAREREAEDRARARENERRDARWRREAAKSIYNHPTFRAGMRAGEDIGLDPQVGQRGDSKPRQITEV